MSSCLFTAPPRLVQEPGDQFIPEGENHKVKVPFRGDGPFRVKVLKDGKEVKV